MKKTILSVSFLIGICFFITGQISRNITTNLSEIKIENVGECDKELKNTLCNEQFPAPDFWHMGKVVCGPGWDDCGEYDYCSPFYYYFYWGHPDILEIESELMGYNIYYYNTHDTNETNIVFNDAVILAHIDNIYANSHKMVIDLEGFVWLTAVYANPDGESEPSNLRSIISSYDFSVINEDGVPIYYNFGEEEMSVVVTHKYLDKEIRSLSTNCSYSGNVAIPETVIYDNQTYTVTGIGKYAFYRIEGWISVTLPNTVTIIDDYAFYGCSGLTEISMPNSVNIIGRFAFSCSDLSSISIGKNVKTILDSAFYYCTALNKLIIPNRDISFGNWIFWFCIGLNEIHNFSPTPQSISGGSFNGVPTNTCKLYVPIGSYNEYREHSVWGLFNNIIETDFNSISEIYKENISVFQTEGGIYVISNEIVNIEIFNLTGQLIYKSIFNESKKIPLEKGVYIISINGENSKIISN